MSNKVFVLMKKYTKFYYISELLKHFFIAKKIEVIFITWKRYIEKELVKNMEYFFI